MAELQWGIARQTFVGGPFDLIEVLPVSTARLEYTLNEHLGTPVRLLKRELPDWETVKECDGK